MPYIHPPQQKRLVEVDTKTNVRQTLLTVFWAVTIVTAAVSIIAAIAAGVSSLLAPGA